MGLRLLLVVELLTYPTPNGYYTRSGQMTHYNRDPLISEECRLRRLGFFFVWFERRLKSPSDTKEEPQAWLNGIFKEVLLDLENKKMKIVINP